MRIHYLSLCLCGLVPAIGCQRTEVSDSANPGDFGCFEGEVVASWDDDGRNMTLRETFTYVDPQNRRWTAPAGSVVNGASIPTAFWTFIGGPFEGKYRNASVVHDVGCVEMTASWEDVHRMFYEACRCAGVDEAKAKILYYAVYHFGPRWQPVTETRVEMCQNADGQMVEQEVTEHRMVRVDPPPPTLEEVEQVEALIEEENPELSVIKQTNRDALRRRPRRGPVRTREDAGAGIAASSREGVDLTTRKRPEASPEHNGNGGKRVEDVNVEERGAIGGKRTPRESRHDGRDSQPAVSPAEQQESPTLPAVTLQEQEWAAQQVRQHIEEQAGQERPAEYDVERTKNGYRVVVRYLRLDEDGQPTSDAIGTSTVRLSRGGQVLEMTSGM